MFFICSDMTLAGSYMFERYTKSSRVEKELSFCVFLGSAANASEGTCAASGG